MTAVLRYPLSAIRSQLIKFALLFILYTLYCILNTSPAFAQSPATPSSQLQPAYNSQPYIPPNSPNSATQAIYNFSHALSCILIGQSPISPCLEYRLFTNAQGITQSVPVLSTAQTNQGIFGFGKALLISLYDNRPLSSAEFLAQMGKQVGLVEEVDAQVIGSGSTILSPVYKLWEVSRNIAYITMIVVFVLVGFMVMFRQRLNPQTVVSIQLALPGLVIGLVMITFSYFLASLITDMAFLGTDLVGYYFQAAQTAPNNPTSLSQLLATQNSISIMSRLTSSIGNFDISSGINTFLDNLSGRPNIYVRTALAFFLYQYGGQFAGAILTPVGALAGAGIGLYTTAGLASIPLAGAGATIGGIIGTLGGGGISSLVGSLLPGQVLNWLISFILTIMMIVTIFRLFLKLLQNFLSIIFYTIISPFVFLMSALPGRQGLVSDWIRNMLCNVLAFPAVVGVLYFCYFLLTGGQPIQHVQDGIQAFAIPDSGINPLAVTNNAVLPLFGGLEFKALNVLLAFGAFLATPSIPDIVCKAIGKIGPAAGMLEQQISGSQRSAQGYSKQAASAPGQLSKDIGGTKALANEKGVNLWGEYTVQRPGAWNMLRNLGRPKI